MNAHIPDGIQHFPSVTATLEPNRRDGHLMLKLAVHVQDLPDNCDLCPADRCVHTHPMLLASRWLQSNDWTMRSGSASHTGTEIRRYDPPNQTQQKPRPTPPEPELQVQQPFLWDGPSTR